MAKGENKRREEHASVQREHDTKSSYSARRRKYLLGNIIKLEVLIVVTLVAFFLGRKTGLDSAREALEANSEGYRNQQYAAGQDGIEIEQITNEKGTSGTGTSGWTNVTGGVIAETSDAEKQVDENPAKELTEEERQEKLEELWEEYPELILVNKDHKLPDDYEVELKKLPDGTNRGSVDVYDALVAMLKAGRKEGLNFEICSSYRSVERQEELFEEDIDALRRQGYSYLEAYEEVAKETMPPGYSEHATGLAFDIVALDYQMLDDKQKNTDESKWLREHCAEYGFILRYPEDKVEITGISFESWHYRYVGVEAAEYIMEKGITLEEYLEEYLAGSLDIY